MGDKDDGNCSLTFLDGTRLGKTIVRYLNSELRGIWDKGNLEAVVNNIVGYFLPAFTLLK